MTARNRKTGPAEKPEYMRTPREAAALDKFRKGHAERAPRIKAVKADGRLVLRPDHPDETTGHLLLMEALGTTDSDFATELVSQLANAGSKGSEIDEQGINFMLSIIKGIKPRDQIEAMLAAQMATVHMATMTFARRLAHVDNIPQQDSAERAFNKLTRTFATQMEALKRYRTGGEQKVTVQHVTVGEGGQAIVGNVTQGRREAASDKAVTDAKAAPMPIIEAKSQAPIPVPRTLKKNER
jgi:hypothetical protein